MSSPFSLRRRPHGANARAATCSLALGVALLAGCVTYAPEPLAPADEIARLRSVEVGVPRIVYQSPEVARDGGARTVDPADGFDEAELVAIALTLQPALRAQRAEIGEAQALLVSADVLPNPDLGAFVRPSIDGASGTAVGLEAIFGLLAPDERPAKRAVADADLALARARVESAERRLAAEVRVARIAVLTAEQSARLLRQELALRDDAVTLLRKQRDLGEATELALTVVELDRATVQRAVREADATAARNRRVLNESLGVPPDLGLALVGSGVDIEFVLVPDVSDDALDSAIIDGNPELRERFLAHARAEGELRLAVAGQYPHFGLGPSFEDDVDGNASLGLAATLELPIFDRGAGPIAEKTAARETARAAYVATLHAIRARAFDSRETLRRARLEVDVQRSEVLPLVQRTEQLFEGALRAREVSIFEWLTARSRAIESRRDLLDALSHYATAAVELDAVTGAPLVSILRDTANEAKER